VDTSEVHSVAVAAIVRDDRGHILAMRRSDHGNWEPPGGVLKADEALHDGLTREIQEETKVRVEPGRLTGVYKNVKRGVLTLVFEASPVDARAEQTNEAVDVRWLPLADARAAFDRDYVAWVEDALSGAPSPFVRSQTESIKGASSSPSSDF
jgi:8-oxo-dGTP diphosphatase